MTPNGSPAVRAAGDRRIRTHWLLPGPRAARRSHRGFAATWRWPSGSPSAPADPILHLAGRQSTPVHSSWRHSTPASRCPAPAIPFKSSGNAAHDRPQPRARVVAAHSSLFLLVSRQPAHMAAQSMLMSTSVNGGRALPSLQAVRTAPYPRLPLLSSSSSYRHSKSASPRSRPRRRRRSVLAISCLVCCTYSTAAATPPRVNPLLYVRTGCSAQA
jgi:hypothetical protein